MKKYIVIALTTVLVGCHPVQLFPYKTPAGQTFYKVECKGTKNVCLHEAEKTCGGGYSIIRQDDNNMSQGHTRLLFNWCQLTFVCGGYDEYVKYRRSQDNTAYYD